MKISFALRGVVLLLAACSLAPLTVGCGGDGGGSGGGVVLTPDKDPTLDPTKDSTMVPSKDPNAPAIPK